MMRYLITGGAGFIGVNLADRLAGMGEEVIVLDNLSRRGSESNLQWLQGRHPNVVFRSCDIRKPEGLEAVFREFRSFDVVIHLAGQVAVTTSVTDPRSDFEINALGPINQSRWGSPTMLDPPYDL